MRFRGVRGVTVVIRVLLVPSIVSLLGISFRMTLSPVRVTCLMELNLLRRVYLIPSMMVTLGGVTAARCATLLIRSVFTLVMKKCALWLIPNVARGRLTLPPNELMGVMAGLSADSRVVTRLPAAAPFIELATLTRANGALIVCCVVTPVPVSRFSVLIALGMITRVIGVLILRRMSVMIVLDLLV